jgi:filamentous hemagglutinin family protein
MASERERGSAGRKPASLSPELIERLQRTAPRPLSSMICAASAAALCLFVHPGAWAATPLPKLPTPCSGGTCGANPGNTPFVTAGSIAGNAPSVSGTTMTINQTSNSAILNWQDFNIANGYSVKFNQPGATAATLNRIWSQDASVIAGHLSSNGQVYLINQNGIVFDHGAQVNVGGLTASTLDISDSLFQNGILSGNKPTQAATALTPVFQARNGQAGGVLVDSGAELDAADGGRIILLGSKVTNNGIINTPDGQTLLGAGNTVYLAASTDPALRGLLLEVDSRAVDGQGNPTGSANPAASMVVNNGQITAARGNVTLAGLMVEQAGQITATTSVSANGSIYLVAGDTSSTSDQNFYNGQNSIAGFGTMLPNTGGTLVLAPGSVTQVLADSTDTGTITNANAAQFQASQVNLVGQTVEMLGNAAIVAPGGNVAAVAATDPFGRFNRLSTPSIAADGASRIYLDSGSTIDVSGLNNVQVPVGQDLVTVKLESNDLQNDPLLRSGFLHGQTVTVNVAGCITTPTTCSTLFDLTPYVNNIAYGIQQKLTTAGKIRFDSSGDVITRAGSVLNVSGGSVAFQAGMATATTQLLGADGRIYDIATAPSDKVQYIALANSYSYTDPNWGVTTSYAPQVYYSGFTQGNGAGSINILSPQAYLRGTMLAQTVAGQFQRSATNLPAGGTFVLGDAGQVPSAQNLVDFRAPSILFEDGLTDNLASGFDPATSFLPANFGSVTTLSPEQLAQSGFNNLGLFSNGSIILPAGTDLKLAAGGSINARAQNIEIDGNIQAPGASVALAATSFVRNAPAGPHDVTLGNGAVIDVSGSWINDSPKLQTQTGTAPLVYNGGNVSLKAADDVVLDGNNLINVSGGGWVNSASKLTAGKAGGIVLAADAELATNAVATGTVQLDSSDTLLGASLAAGKGGSLSLQAGTVTVGQIGTATGAKGEMFLPAFFFQQGGFARYDIRGVDGVSIGPDFVDQAGNHVAAPITINPLQQTLVFDQPMLQQATGSALSGFTQLALLTPELRSPASISFSSASSLSGVSGSGDVTLSAGSKIVTDPGGSVSLTVGGNFGNLNVLGSIAAPAGSINLQLGPNSVDPSSAQFVNNQQLLLGSSATLSATAIAQIYSDNPAGLRQGQVLNGGTVSLKANQGFVVTEAGSLIDVSGAQGTIDVAAPGSVTPVTVAGAAGSIQIDAREGLVLHGDLRGTAAAVPGAAGGSLSIGLDLMSHNVPVNSGGFPLNDRVLTLTGAPASSLPSGPAALVSGSAQVSTGTIQAGGFDNITLTSTDVIAMAGVVTLNSRGSLILDAPKFQGNAGASVSLSSSYVGLGHYFNGNDPLRSDVKTGVTPDAGNANLVAIGGTVDVRGSSVLAGFATTTLESRGDLRLSSAQNFTDINGQLLNNSLYTAGDLILQAGQVYPTTAVNFELNTPGTVRILPGTATMPSATPLSAGGQLTITAQNIDQEGVLRAPLGQITLNAGATGSVTLAPGSLTSVSADGQLIPYGSTQNGQQWLYAATTLVGAPPAKQVSIKGATVDLQKGSKVDLSGGGDIYAYEFIAGPGGSKDVLDPANGVYNYAILPSLGANPAPIDGQYGAGTSIAPGKDVYLSGVPGLAAGYYTLLPARYALLPGAYAVKVVQGNSDLPQGSAQQLANGSYLVAGRMGVSGTDILDSRTSTIQLTPGAVVRTQSQYNDSHGDTFFSAAAAAAGKAAPQLAADAGQLALGATGSLTLNGSVDFQTASFVSGKDSSGKDIVQQGRGGVASIVAPSILVEDPGATQNVPAGTLQLDAAALNQLGAASLVLGASESSTAQGTQLNVGANSVEIANTSAHALVAPEIILAGSQSVKLDQGGDVEGKGSSGAPAPATLLVNGDGAALRVSGGKQTTLDRSGAPAAGSATGTLSIASGATVKADGSMILDAAANDQIDGGANLSAPAVTLSSSQINLGQVPAGAQGLNLNSQLLAGFKGLNDLGLHSYGTIDFFGAVQLGAMDAGGKPVLASVTFDAGALGGHGAGDKTVNAGSIVLLNSGNSSSAFAIAPDGSGALRLDASGASGNIVLGAGSKSIQGFGGVQLAGSGDLQAQGRGGTLNLVNAGNLDLRAARLVTADGADQAIVNQSGAVAIDAVSPAAGTTQSAPGIGGKLSISGTSIAQNGVIDLPAGVVSLHATGAAGAGDITLGAGSTIAATGVVKPYGDTYAAASGGQVALTSDNGSVSLASGATIDVSGASSADKKVSGGAGSLAVSATNGQFVLAGTLKGGAAPGQLQGNFSLDAGSITDFDALSAALGSGGFHGAVAARARGGDLDLGSGRTLQASSVTLSADQGSIRVAGTIDTSGGDALSADGGSIGLWAGRDVVLASGGSLLAKAGATASGGRPTQGGNVTLGTTGLGGGAIDLQSGSIIDLAGSSASTSGVLTLRAPRTGNGVGADLGVREAAGAIRNTRMVVLEGFQTYQGSSLYDSTVDAGGAGSGALDISQNGMMYQDAAGFAANAVSVSRLFGSNPAQTVQLRAGVEVRSGGDLALNDVWDLSQWRFNGAPVNLSLRAAGNLLFNKSLSDGFTNTSPGSAPSSWAFGATGHSASYRLTAGADLAAANPLGVASAAQIAQLPTSSAEPSSGNLVVASSADGTLIRTGDGSIDIAAGRDVLIGCPLSGGCSSDPSSPDYNPAFNQAQAQQSVIYTAGAPSATVAGFTPPATKGGATIAAAYPTGGGNLSISAARDIRSAPSAQLVSDWMWRRGASPSAGAGQGVNTTTWWIMYNNFQQGVGALGGGQLLVQAGGNIDNLSAVVPSTGRLAQDGTLVVDGGGTLRIRAGGNIRSGVFETDWGNALVSAGESIGSGRTLGDTNPLLEGSLTTPLPDAAIYPVLVYGYHAGGFQLSARTDLTVDAAVNATTLPEAAANSQAIGGSFTQNVANSYFYSFAADSSLELLSSAGDVVLNNDTVASANASILGNLSSPPGRGGHFAYDRVYDYSNLALYPPVVNVAALTGNIISTNQNLSTGLYPSAVGNLNLLAQNNLVTANGFQLYEVDPLAVANIDAPSRSLGSSIALTALPATPLHQGDSQPVRMIAASGDIVGGDLIFPKPAELIAGNDIRDISYSGKNLSGSDVTLFEAGDSISFTTPTNPLTHALLSNTAGIQVGGPGYVEVLAGNNINLGDSTGIVSTGNLNDSRLAASGANLVVGAGLGSSGGGLRQPAYAPFISTYLKPGASGAPSAYAPQLIAYMKQLLGLSDSDSLSYADALNSFQALPVKQQLPLVAQVLYAELSATGIAHNSQHSSYDRGYAAINALFPTQDAQGKPISYSGDINMFFSQIKTEQGGDINLLAPGGSVVVGVPNPPAELSTVKASATATGAVVPAAANLGLLVLGSGAIRGFADQSFTVNQSRILTLEGGDIILWASNGDIDAGKGAKSASAAPPPVIQTDSQGNVFVNPLGAVSGSGIGQLVTKPGITPGLVNLIAPKGDVNAGDAGIRVAGNLNIAAVVVIGADNISVGGTASGVPVSDAGALSGALSGANSLGDAGKNAVNSLTQNLADASAAAQQLADSLKPSFVVVKLICLGNECELQ